MASSDDEDMESKPVVFTPIVSAVKKWLDTVDMETESKKLACDHEFMAKLKALSPGTAEISHLSTECSLHQLPHSPSIAVGWRGVICLQ